MFLFYSHFSLYEHFIRQMTYAVVLYSKLRDVWRKRFYTNTLLFFLPCLGQLLRKYLYINHYVAVKT